MSTIDFGIDLGTTNSSVACCRGGELRIFQTTELMTVTPSVVYLGRNGRMLVGKKAYDAWPGDPQNTQAEFKRWMGFSDKLHFPAANRDMSAEELSAEVLKSLRADVRRATGEELTASVITVPAAFGALQCDATGRAAKMAGFLEAPLLQEPIAAAIAYGASAASDGGQRWMVFDLGGGTLDIAVVSTRNGRLAVLEHQGNNRLGGKDIDRAIAERLIWPALAGQFKLPAPDAQPQEYQRLFRQIVRLAEQAKIALSTADSAPIDVFNIGADTEGNPIEATLTLTRAEMDQRIEPLVANCLELVRRALAGARLGAGDVDRLLLVGGPTQMPAIRGALASVFPRGAGVLDHSLDPMTVVAQGAALYASTVERTTAGPAAPAVAGKAAESADTKAGTAGAAAQLKLNHERASGTPQSPVAGTFTGGPSVEEVKIDAEGGVWSSGWVAVAKKTFVMEVLLTPHKPVTKFRISGRTRSGAAVALEPGEFAIAFMLPMAAPPLPHTIAIELSADSSRPAFDPVFKRHTPLPAEAHKTYRADRTLRPSDGDTTLPIKFWEIEVSDDPQERWWDGCVHIRAETLKRPLMEGTEISLTVKIDKSRKMTVEVFVPALNEGFTDNVYVPDPPTAKNQLQEQLGVCFDRMHRVMQAIYADDRDDLREDAQTLQMKLEFIAEQLAEHERRAALTGGGDPDALLAATENLRKIRVYLTQLEEQLSVTNRASALITKVKGQYRYTASLVAQFGNPAQQEPLEKLRAQMDRYIDSNDTRGLRYVYDQLCIIASGLNANRAEFWQGWHDELRHPSSRYVNAEQAAHWIQRADDARARNDLTGLKESVRELWKLRLPDQLEASQDQAMQSGLKSD
ncbi:MAG TPA: Hsp70 family protein [Phycisphaerae bacterium]|nr:Hsp70 family protein [Phycisphaerae bacterium]